MEEERDTDLTGLTDAEVYAELTAANARVSAARNEMRRRGYELSPLGVWKKVEDARPDDREDD